MGKTLMNYFGRDFRLAETKQIYSTAGGVPVSSGSEVSGTTTYTASAPTFLIEQTSGTDTMTVLKDLLITQVGTAGGNIECAIAVTPTKTYSSGGLKCMPVLTHGSLTSAAPDFKVYASKPAISLGAALPSTVRWLARRTIDVGDGFETSFGDLFERMGYPSITAEGTIHIYLWAPNTKPKFRFAMIVGDQPAASV